MENGEISQTPVERKLETGERVFNFLDKTNLLELRKNDNEFNNWMEKISYEDFSSYLVRLNGILRDIPIKDRNIDGKNIELLSPMFDESLIRYLPPQSDKKEILMEQTFEAVKKIDSNDDRALLLYYAIQAIHPFADGNGRTGRLLYEIISDNGKDITQETLSRLLNHNDGGNDGTGEGRNVFGEKILEPNKAYYYINREVAKAIFGDDFLRDYGKLVADGLFIGSGYLPKEISGLSEQEIKSAKKIIGEADVKNFSFRSLVLIKLLTEKGVLPDYQSQEDILLEEMHNVTPEDIGKKILIFDAEKAIDDLTGDDVRRLIEIHRDIKMKFMETMIDVFTNPVQHQIKNEQGESIPIKDMFVLP